MIPYYNTFFCFCERIFTKKSENINFVKKHKKAVARESKKRYNDNEISKFDEVNYENRVYRQRNGLFCRGY